MARWFMVDAVMRNISKSAEQERLGLDIEEDTIVRSIMLDLDRLESFSPNFDDEGDESSDSCLVITHAGVEMVLKISFYELEKAVRG